MIQFLKIVFYYSNNEKQLCFREIISTDTIHWLLETLAENTHNCTLSCIISLVLLSIVTKHMEKIKIEFIEKAIIELFH